MLSHPMTRPRRALLILTLIVAAAAAITACGDEGISSSLEGKDLQAAQLFNSRCSGCHTLSVAGTQGSATNVRTREYKDGPNFGQRHETVNCVLYAIRNGGFSSGPMPQDIVTGPNAQLLADFVAKYSKPETGTRGTAQDCPPG
jgi:mono/diheme cytochrome c family protein